ncbi:MAG: hypothetical protein RLZZ70_335 [Candidatus Parcubacteria bacterium]
MGNDPDGLRCDGVDSLCQERSLFRREPVACPRATKFRRWLGVDDYPGRGVDHRHEADVADCAVGMTAPDKERRKGRRHLWPFSLTFVRLDKTV